MLVFVAVYIFTGVVFVACGADKGNDTADGWNKMDVECDDSRIRAVSAEVGCVDREGRPVPNGARFAPDEDPCKTCYCADGIAQLCTLVQCSPPACKKWRPVQNECCQYKCLDAVTGADADRNSTLHRYGFSNIDSTNVDIRLALSGTTTLLIIALLVFMVHRLRQRRLLIIMRRITEDQHCIEQDDSVYGADDLTGFEFLAYKDPPPPYSSPPGTLSRHYDPPPYETAARMAAASQYNVQDVDGVYVSGASVSSPASVENVSECESQVDTHIRQTRV